MWVLWWPIVAVIGAVAGVGAYADKGIEDVSWEDQNQFDIPDPDPGTERPRFSGLTVDKWDDAVVGLILVGLVLFSKPWK